MPKLKSGDAVQVTVSAPSRYHPLARGVLRRHRLLVEPEDGVPSIGGNVLWMIETSEGKTFEVPEVLLAKVEEE